MKDVEKARAFHFFLLREVMGFLTVLQCLCIVWRWQGPVVACCLLLNAATLSSREYAFAASGLFADQGRIEDVEEILCFTSSVCQKTIRWTLSCSPWA